MPVSPIAIGASIRVVSIFTLSKSCRELAAEKASVTFNRGVEGKLCASRVPSDTCERREDSEAFRGPAPTICRKGFQGRQAEEKRGSLSAVNVMGVSGRNLRFLRLRGTRKVGTLACAASEILVFISKASVRLSTSTGC